jgi:hypothetical protein
MEAMLGISLYSCLYLKLAKMQCLSYYLLLSYYLSLRFLFNKIRMRGRNKFCLEVRGVEGKQEGKGQEGAMAQTMYAHTNK